MAPVIAITQANSAMIKPQNVRRLEKMALIIAGLAAT